MSHDEELSRLEHRLHALQADGHQRASTLRVQVRQRLVAPQTLALAALAGALAGCLGSDRKREPATSAREGTPTAADTQPPLSALLAAAGALGTWVRLAELVTALRDKSPDKGDADEGVRPGQAPDV